MRMWNVPPAGMCRQHLLGEHLEMHMFVGHIAKGRLLGKFVVSGLVNTRLIKKRHDELAAEMTRRGYEHKSPLAYSDRLKVGQVDVEDSLLELHRRCPECRELGK